MPAVVDDEPLMRVTTPHVELAQRLLMQSCAKEVIDNWQSLCRSPNCLHVYSFMDAQASLEELVRP